MNWFRFYHEALDDPKVQRLDPCLFKAWVNLLCLASKSEDRGSLPAVEDIAFALRLDDIEAQRVIDELSAKGLIERTETGFAPHNWGDRQKQSDDVTARVRKHRSGPTGNVTLPETDKKRFGNGLDTEEKRGDREGEEKRARKRATQTPNDLPLDDDDYAWANEKLNISPAQCDRERDAFLEWHTAKGNLFKDWKLAWRSWMRKAKPDLHPAKAGAIVTLRDGRVVDVSKLPWNHPDRAAATGKAAIG